ncbi:hypothetical protein BH10PLA2_BH10PLA2_35670 [soil metagenome]
MGTKHVGILELVDIGRVPLSGRLITDTVDNLPNERVARGVEDSAGLRVANVIDAARQIAGFAVYRSTQRDKSLISRKGSKQVPVIATVSG